MHNICILILDKRHNSNKDLLHLPRPGVAAAPAGPVHHCPAGSQACPPQEPCTETNIIQEVFSHISDLNGPNAILFKGA